VVREVFFLEKWSERDVQSESQARKGKRMMFAVSDPALRLMPRTFILLVTPHPEPRACRVADHRAPTSPETTPFESFLIETPEFLEAAGNPRKH